MEKNRTKYWLAAALIGIWGLVAFRFYQRTSPNSEVPAPNQSSEGLKAVVTSQDSFSLLLTYDNPFSMTETPSRVLRPIKLPSPKKVVLATRPKEVKPEPKPIVFPTLDYRGNIKMKSGRMVAIITMDGSISNVGVGEKLHELTLLKIYEDSIRVKYQKTEKTILRNRQ